MAVLQVLLGLVIGLASQSQSLVVGSPLADCLPGFSPLGAIGVCCAFNCSRCINYFTRT